MINEGHIVGNHTVNHKSMPDISDEEIKRELMTLNQTLFEKFGYEMKYMRPPKGEFSERTLSITDSLGFRTVMWSFAYVDWNEDSQPAKEDAMNKIISNLHNGEIMLLHATSKTNSEIMSELIDKVRNEGYEYRIMVDGGVSLKNHIAVKEAGADILITGEAFFRSQDKASFIEEMES